MQAISKGNVFAAGLHLRSTKTAKVQQRNHICSAAARKPTKLSPTPPKAARNDFLSSSDSNAPSAASLLCTVGAVGLVTMFADAQPALALEENLNLWEQYQDLPGELRGAIEVVLIRGIVAYFVGQKLEKDVEEAKLVCEERGVEYKDLFVQPGEGVPARFGEFGWWAPTPEGEPRSTYGKVKTIMRNRVVMEKIKQECESKGLDILGDINKESYPTEHKMFIEFQKRAEENGIVSKYDQIVTQA
mmetsp:Transcript_43320/g.52445  ORF Transcript_43320/g.52445 Transcript_43320/m.52445 type:complete len:245 (-) Transcript_43320:420-1154(-)|eukprot:CAMPEP_0197846656 /NCGR_PEP_ID=MMETSP1438-20131217/3990_1 /TAXON_ID=1461541 /ORGANISM="Pterosperma sp., Strain CCMP1384" /LENGTH=244 /DNA_ID=CAMNT_0043458377 /DNA_START=101 /DNA_END=835 /DNA_ORIENTATION=-